MQGLKAAQLLRPSAPPNSITFLNPPPPSSSSSSSKRNNGRTTTTTLMGLHHVPHKRRSYFALTIPKRVWSQIPHEMMHKKRVGFYEWHGGLVTIFYDKLKVEKSSKVRVIDPGWRDIAEQNGYAVGRGYRFEVQREDAVERLIQVTPI